jgi:hypothetical protein
MSQWAVQETGARMMDPYSRLAATLWFISSDRLENLLQEAEEMALESFRETLDG